MTPFRVFDRNARQMYIVINYHPVGNKGGSYLVAKEDDTEDDGMLQLIPAEELAEMRLVEFIADQEGE